MGTHGENGRRAQWRGCALEIHGLQGGEERQRCRDGGGAVRAEVVEAANTRRGEWVAKDRRDRAVKSIAATESARQLRCQEIKGLRSVRCAGNGRRQYLERESENRQRQREREREERER